MDEFALPIKTIGEIINHKLNQLSDWNEVAIKALIDDIKNETKLSGKQLFMPIRMLTTHKEHGPELAKIIWLYGKDVVQKNIADFLELMNAKK